jgi:peptidoglycan/xylan/chitin deacetylase (PgdA/CDA1 family)
VSARETIERGLLGWLSPSGRRGRLLILTYHRVLRSADELLPDEPDAAGFAAQMDVVGKYCRVLPLPEAVSRLREGTLPARAACITFDDGYENNLSVALPILEQRGMTGTVFIAVDAIQRGIMWNDLIIEGVRAATHAVDMSVLDETPLAITAASERPRIIGELLNRLKYLPLEQRWNLATRFFAANSSAALPRLMLREEQVREFATRGHDVGAHTMSHPILKELTAARADAEIGESGRWLRDVTGRTPRSFAYPNGRPNRDYDATHVAMVRSAGFELAVSTSWGCATRRSDMYQLPRCTPWELSSRWFAARLAKNYLMHAD